MHIYPLGILMTSLLLLLYQIALRILFYTLCTHLLENCFITGLLFGLGIPVSHPDV